MHPLWLTDHFHPAAGGMARSCDRIVHHLRQDGLDIDLVHFVPPQNTSQSWNWEPRQHGSDFRCTMLEDRPHALNLLWNEIKDHAYTHVVAFGAETPMLASPAFAAWLKVPLITMIRGNDFDVGIFSRKKREVLLGCLEASDSIGVVSTDKVAKVRALFPHKKVYHTPNGIEISEWRKLPSHNIAKHETRLVIGLIGQLKEKKGVCFFLDAIKASGLADQIHLQITGVMEDAALERLQSMAPRLTFQVTPFVPHSQLPAHYLSCDYVAIPSFYDGMPNVLLEAGALGVPVMASATGGIIDVVEDGTHGFLFQNNNQSDCVTALRKTLRVHDDERDTQGEALRKHISENFTCSNERDIMKSILKDTLRP